VDPLAHPASNHLLRRFRLAYRLSEHGGPRQQLGELVRAFAALPYENLTKIIKESQSGWVVKACRTPHEVLADHQRWRTGGTCFSLTATLLHLVRSLGMPAEPILADRRYGADTHCALLAWLDGQPHLLDPGYLIFDPLSLNLISARGRVLSTPWNQIELLPSGPQRIDLYTIQQKDRRYRLTWKTSPVDHGQFLRAWRASFDWEMMHYPLLNKITPQCHIYMRGGHLQQRSTAGIERQEVPRAMQAERMASLFGIDPEVIRNALLVLQRRGD